MSTANENHPSPPLVPAERPGKVGGKRDANRRRRTAQLCQAALGLYLEHGIGSVSVDQIVARAGVAKGSFYRYFADQTQLVETLLAPLADGFAGATDRCEARLDGAAPAALPGIYLQLASELAASVAGQLDLLRLYLQESRSPPAGARRPVRELADEITRRGVHLSTVARDAGLLRESDPRIGALTVIGAVERMAFGLLAGEDLGRLEQIPSALIDMILDGVRGAR